MHNHKVEEFISFLESVERTNPDIIKNVKNYARVLFADNNIILESSKADLLRELGKFGEPVLNAAKNIIRGTDDVAKLARESKVAKEAEAISDLASLGKEGKIAKEGELIADANKLGKEGESLSDAKKLADDVKVKDAPDVPKAKKSGKLGKVLKVVGASSLLSSIFGDDEDIDEDDDNVEVVDISPEKDTSGRYWPNNFHTGGLSGTQQRLIDMTSLFGPPELPSGLISQLNTISSMNESDIKDAAIRYAQSYSYWTDIYKRGMNNAYDDQMDKPFGYA